MKSLKAVILLAVIAVLATGCQTTSQGSRTYTRGEAQKPLQVTYGTVMSVAEVTIETEETGAGTLVGGIVGGIVGSTIGDGDGQKLATAGGVLLGSAVGSATEKGMGTKAALELEVELDNGEVLVVVQEKDDVFHPGDRIRVIETSYGRMRVRH
ncbi:MAG: glycine zipper 2TM domain-containing protein [Puniceicoccaceae bacterium]